MYTPKHFENSDLNKIKKVINENPLATVISQNAELAISVNHYPFVFHPDQDQILIGHMARRNSQWKDFAANPKGQLIFHGPNAYISPSWYKTGCDVPTWNYVSVHCYGEFVLKDSFAEQIEILKILSQKFESSQENPWQFELPEDLKNPEDLTSAIISFHFKIEKIQAKFKLSQNRKKEDIDGVLQGLSRVPSENSQKIKEWMQF